MEVVHCWSVIQNGDESHYQICVSSFLSFSVLSLCTLIYTSAMMLQSVIAYFIYLVLAYFCLIWWWCNVQS